jgi:hypothetical protein
MIRWYERAFDFAPPFAPPDRRAATCTLTMRKHAVVLTLTLLELLALLLLAFFGLVMRPDLAVTYGLGEEGSRGAAAAASLPAATRLALAPAVVPAIAAGGALLFVSAWFSRRVSLRNRLLGAAFVWTVLGLGWTVWAAYAPAFEHL